MLQLLLRNFAALTSQRVTIASNSSKRIIAAAEERFAAELFPKINNQPAPDDADKPAAVLPADIIKFQSLTASVRKVESETPRGEDCGQPRGPCETCADTDG